MSASSESGSMTSGCRRCRAVGTVAIKPTKWGPGGAQRDRTVEDPVRTDTGSLDFFTSLRC